MHIVAAFPQTLTFELAIDAVERKGNVPKKDIFAIPLVPKLGQRNIFDTIHRSDGMSLTAIPALLGTFLSVIGAIYGFILEWGPVIWGLIGLAAGMIPGFMIELLLNKKRLNRKKLKSKEVTEVFLIIKCEEQESDLIEKLLYDHFAIGVAKIYQ